MALKPDRSYTNEATDISFFMNETGEKGEVLVFSAAGSGAAMDDATAVVTTPSTNPSGEYLAGILMNDVVNLDLTRQHINWQKDEVQLGGKVTLLRRGTITTNMIGSGVTPAGGDHAYVIGGAVGSALTSAGRLTTEKVVDTGPTAASGTSPNQAQYLVGQFLSIKDVDGYCK